MFFLSLYKRSSCSSDVLLAALQAGQDIYQIVRLAIDVVWAFGGPASCGVHDYGVLT